MARTITYAVVMAADQVIEQVAAVNDSRYNPLERTAKVQIFAVASAADILLSFSLGSDEHAAAIVLPIAAAVSTRDHLVGDGVGFRGQKITIGVRATAIATARGMLVISPM